MIRRSVIAILLFVSGNLLAQPLVGPLLIQHLDSGNFEAVKIVARNDSIAQVFYTVKEAENGEQAYCCAYSLTHQSVIGTPQVLFSEAGWSASIISVTVNGAGRWNCVVNAWELGCDTCHVRTIMLTGLDDLRQSQQIYEGTYAPYHDLYGQPYLEFGTLYSRPAGGAILYAQQIRQQGSLRKWRPMVMYFENGQAAPASQYEYAGPDTVLSMRIGGAVVTADDRLYATVYPDSGIYTTTLPPPTGQNPALTYVECPFMGQSLGGRLLNIGFNEMRGGLPYIKIDEFHPEGTCNELGFYTVGCCFLFPGFNSHYGWAVVDAWQPVMGLARIDTSGAMVQPVRAMFSFDNGNSPYESDVAISDGGLVMVAWTEFVSSDLRRSALKIASIGWATALSAEDPTVNRPSSFKLEAYPNPFNSQTTISFELARESAVSLKIFDLLGREAATLAQGKYSSGSHIVNWNATGLASGVYLVRLEGVNQSATRKLLLLK